MTSTKNQKLEFGTGGIRGIMGPNSDQMNHITVSCVVQGFSNYINHTKSAPSPSVVIAYDSRHNSKEYAHLAASLFAANNIKTYLFKSLETTPVLSFAVRHLKCVAGLCITASHNPPQYNGIKVYWSDGAQIVPPQDKKIVQSIEAINTKTLPEPIDFEIACEQSLISFLNDDLQKAYFKDVENTLNACLNTDELPKNKDLSIVYTPLHGTGHLPATALLKRLHFNNFFVVPEQQEPDGAFPTVEKPNPEEAKALKLALQYAHDKNADVIFATDPDSDRLAVCIKDSKNAKKLYKTQSQGDYVLLNGNQTGALLLYFILENLKENNKLTKNHKTIKTMVTSRFLELISNAYNVEMFNTPTGFKWIALLIQQWETQNSKNKFLFGAEESFGYMFGNNVRDKDAIAAIGFTAEMINFFKSKGKTLCDILLELFKKFGAWQEDLINIECDPTPEGMAKISNIMEKFRNSAPRSFAGISVKNQVDYLNRDASALNSFPQANVLQFTLEDNSQISVRPSGTEPKLKIYLSVCTKSPNVEEALQQTHDKIQSLRYELLTFTQ